MCNAGWNRGHNRTALTERSAKPITAWSDAAALSKSCQGGFHCGIAESVPTLQSSDQLRRQVDHPWVCSRTVWLARMGHATAA
jgi:hypothetical protein